MNPTPDENEELRELVDALLDSLATDEQVARLNDMLAGDPAAIDYYLRRTFVSAFLREGGGGATRFEPRLEERVDESEAPPLSRDGPLRTPRARAGSWHRARTWGMAASVALALGLMTV